MREFFISMFIDPFTEAEGFIGYALASLIWVLGLAIIFIIGWGAGYLIDSSFLSTKEDKGVIVNKYIIPAHTTTTYIQSGKVLVPIITHHDTNYVIEIQIGDLTDDVSIDEVSYNQIEINDKAFCKYSNGRILNSLYIKEVEFISW